MEPIFYEPNEWKFIEAHFLPGNFEPSEKPEPEHGDSWEGTMYIKVGEYGDHSLLIHPEIYTSLIDEQEQKESGRTVFQDIYPFVGGKYIFIPELPLNARSYELMDQMWTSHESICDRAYHEIDEYFKAHHDEMLTLFFHEAKKAYPKTYQDFVRRIEEYTSKEENDMTK